MRIPEQIKIDVQARDPERQMDSKIAQKGTREHAMVTPGRQKTSRDPKEASFGDQMGHLGTQKKPQRESRWAPRLPKGVRKGTKLEPLKNTKTELWLQRELNPAYSKASKSEHQNWMPQNEAQRTQDDGQKEPDGHKRTPVPPWRSGGSPKAPALGAPFIYRYIYYILFFLEPQAHLGS